MPEAVQPSPEIVTTREQQAMFDTCFEYDDHLRANGHWAGGEALEPAENAMTPYWKNGKVATTDGCIGACDYRQRWG